MVDENAAPIMDLIASHVETAGVYEEAVERLTRGLVHANTAELRAHQIAAISKAKSSAARLNNLAARMHAVVDEIDWWRATYPDVEPFIGPKEKPHGQTNS